MRPAVWLMDRFGVSESLVGDLVEERSRKHSTLWLWRQVLVAIVGTVAGDIRAHKWLAIRAVVLGWGVGQFVALFRRILMPLMLGRWVWLSEGWLENALGFPVMPLPFMIVMSAGAVITGLVVARLHRGHEMSMVFAYIGALLLFYTFGFFNSLARGLQTFGGMYGLAVNSLFPFIVTPALVLIGGLLSGTRHRGQPVA